MPWGVSARHRRQCRHCRHCPPLPAHALSFISAVLALLHLPAAHAQLPPWRFPDWSWVGYRGGAPLPIDLPGAVYNVRDYGAAGDGWTNDSPAIQAAINAAAKAGGGVVYLPAARYAIHSTLRVTSSNTVIKGAGKGSTILFAPYSLAESRPDDYLNAAGDYSKYCWKDAYIEIFGKTKMSSFKSLVARVTTHRARGLTSVRVERVPGKMISPGDELWLFQSEPKPPSVDRGTLSAYLHGWDTLAGEDLPQKCAVGRKRDACLSALFGKKDLVRWLVKVKEVKKDGNVWVLERPLPFDLRPEWSAEFHRFKPGSVLRESGVEDLTLEFPLTPMAPHHLEKGYNGVELRWTVDSWIRNVDVVNADNAIFVRTSHHVTVTGVETSTNGDRSPNGVSKMNGHIGIGVIGSADVYVVDFNVKAMMLHDTTVVRTILSVWHRGRGTDLNLDAHRHICFANLYSHIDLGIGSRPFTMGGRDGEGLPLAAYTAFWGLSSARGAPLPVRNDTARFGLCSYGGNFVAFVGDFVQEGTCPGWFIKETVVPEPTDLFVDQAVRRLGAVPV